MPSVAAMKWSSALSRETDPIDAVAELTGKLHAALGDAQPDLLIVFVSYQHREHFTKIAAALRRSINPRHFAGCTGGAIIGENTEVEEAHAIAAIAATLPGVEIHPFRFSDQDLPDLDGGPRPWEDAVGVKPADEPAFIVMIDPFSLRADDLLNGLDFAYPKSVKVGGLASAANQAGQNALFLNEAVFRGGAVGIALTGNIRLDALVTQGCRPIGQPLTVTKCRRNFLLGLNEQRPIQVVQDLYRNAPEDDQELIRSSLRIGIIMDPFKQEKPEPGDFLIRNILGQTPDDGGLAISAVLREGQLVQFHVGDSAAAHQDLNGVLRRYSKAMLQEGKGDSLPPPPAGALLFSCLGRGRHMYGHPNHDTENFQTLMGPVPVAGFFCNGEIGPVGGTTYVHGFTSCFGLFRPKAPAIPNHPTPDS